MSSLDLDVERGGGLGCCEGGGLGPLTGRVVVSLDRGPRGPAAACMALPGPRRPLPPGGAGSVSPRRSPTQAQSLARPLLRSPTQPRSLAVAGASSLLSGSSGQKGWEDAASPGPPRRDACLPRPPRMPAHPPPCWVGAQLARAGGERARWPQQPGRCGIYGKPLCLWPPVLTVRGLLCLLQGLAPAWGFWVGPLPPPHGGRLLGTLLLPCWSKQPGASKGHPVWLIS